MQTIACLSQKGGVGKSTLSRLIAVTFANAQYRVKIADFNLKQLTAVKWAAARKQASYEPVVDAESFTTVGSVLRFKDLYDLIVFDGRPDSDTTSIDIAKVSNIVIIPSGTSLDDLVPQIGFARELQAKGITKDRLVFALNQVTRSGAAIREAKDLIVQNGYAVLATTIPKMPSYESTQNIGKAISETGYATLDKAAAGLAEEVYNRMTGEN